MGVVSLQFLRQCPPIQCGFSSAYTIYRARLMQCSNRNSNETETPADVTAGDTPYREGSSRD